MRISTINAPTSKGARTAPAFLLQLDSVGDALRAPTDPRNAAKPAARYTDPTSTAIDSRGRKWFGVDTQREALEIIGGRGWKDGAEKVAAAFGEIEAAHLQGAKSIRRRKVWGEDGDTCDPDRLRSGQYETAFQSMRRAQKTTAGKVIRIFADMDTHWGEDSEEVFWTGATALYLTDALETAGYRAEVYAANFGTNSVTGKCSLATVCLKESDEPVSVDQLAATLCLTGFVRTVLFHAGTALPEDSCPYSNYTGTVSIALLRAAGLWEDGDLIIPHIRSQRDAEEFIKTALDRTSRGETENSDEGETPSLTPYSPQPAPYTPPAPVGPQITAAGDTYTSRGTLKRAGFVWDKPSKAWKAPASSEAARALMSTGIPGVTFSEE